MFCELVKKRFDFYGKHDHLTKRYSCLFLKALICLLVLRGSVKLRRANLAIEKIRAVLASTSRHEYLYYMALLSKF